MIFQDCYCLFVSSLVSSFTVWSILSLSMLPGLFHELFFHFIALDLPIGVCLPCFLFLLSSMFTIYIYTLNFRVTNGYYHHFCMHDTLPYHHQPPVETKGSGSSPLPSHKVPLETKGLSAIRTIILRARDTKISCPGNPPR